MHILHHEHNFSPGTIERQQLTLSRATEQYFAAGAILKPLCLSKSLTLMCDNTCQKLFPGHISVSCLQTRFSCNAETLISHYMCTAIIGFVRGRVKL